MPRAPKIYRDLLSLAAPMLIGQLAVVANGMIDLAMSGHLSAADLAAVGLGASIQVTVYIALSGVLFGMGPIVGQLFGARQWSTIGVWVGQGMWLALLLAVPGWLILNATSVWLAMAKPDPDVARILTNYLHLSAWGLPAAVMFRVFYTLNSTIGRPIFTTSLQLMGLALKAPLNLLLMHGAYNWQGLGGAGCAAATAIITWCQLLVMVPIVLRARSYQDLHIVWFGRPQYARILEIARIGIPIGLSFLIDVSTFTLMAVFVARLGTTAGAAHQITANLAAMTFMLPLALSNAATVLTSHALGAKDYARVRLVVKAGLTICLVGASIIVLTQWLGNQVIARLYTDIPHVQTLAASLIALSALNHTFDGAQCYFGFVLRSFKVTRRPVVIYALCLWGIGLGGGIALGLGHEGQLADWGVPMWSGHGVAAFWLAAALAYLLASVLLGHQVWLKLKTLPTAGM